jgi:hypothetical protein
VLFARPRAVLVGIGVGEQVFDFGALDGEQVFDKKRATF